MFLLKPKIIGAVLAIGLTLAVAPAYAIYSPPIANQIATMRQHAFDARQLNGTGSIRQGVEKVFDGSTESVEELPGQYFKISQDAKLENAKQATGGYGESLLLIFNYLPEQKYTDKHGNPKTNPGQAITSCLRDDIFELQDLQQALLRTSLKSSVLRNKTHADILQNDYETLSTIITLLKSRFDETDLFFPGGIQNYYTDCPTGGFLGEYEPAFKQFENSFNTFLTMGSGSNAQWGDIWSMAKSRARQNAAQWIAKNQISLSFSSEQGGSATSLLKGEGLGGIAADFETQWQTMKGMVTAALPRFDAEFFEAFNTPYAIAQKLALDGERQKTALFQAETSLTFNLKFNSISETNINSLEKSLVKLNTEIQRASEAFGGEGGEGLPSLCENIKSTIDEQCVNKSSSETFSCK